MDTAHLDFPWRDSPWRDSPRRGSPRRGLLRLGFLLLAGLLLVSGRAAAAAEVRYFGVWNYVENRPMEELAPSDLDERSLGYWALQLDGDGVERATYHASTGAPWITVRYVKVDGRVYADIYTGDGRDESAYVARRSTLLTSRRPHWPESD